MFKKQKKTSWLPVPAKPKRSKKQKGLLLAAFGSIAVGLTAIINGRAKMRPL